ncbi:MAG: [FeFe] hydrogenase H-cluster maturation GTPase HydF [Treponema sp.]|jgi:[FeFe] hydrogenase H-cluster maturation GTPase HydF|nr:[FeFe] hydrogenase H-cluster maturation GTPase HydF [Treponema sp.]
MKMNETPSANRVHIAFFGRRNAGKSSLVNAITGQNLALVSDVKGTTTDPVYKAMELLPLGPVVIIDTPGFDDEGELGELRVQRARQVLNKIDIAVLALDASSSSDWFFHPAEEELINFFREKNIPYITVLNKCDLNDENSSETFSGEILPVSAKTGVNINLLKEKIAALASGEKPKLRLVADIIQNRTHVQSDTGGDSPPLDFVVLVIPIDKAAPKGRLILPQQQVIRDILEAGGVTIAVKESELRETLNSLGKKPSLVITDSQVFAEVATIVPQEIPLTSFSILFARFKGFLETAVRGASTLDNLHSGDKILICEGCTHHRQCDDIGTVKIPRMIKKHASIEPESCFCSGGDFPQDLSSYRLVIHCGACMLNEREMQYRRVQAETQNIPFTNYGIAIAHIQGILKRSIAMFNAGTGNG